MCTKFGEFMLKFNELGVQGSASVRTTPVTQNWLRSNCSDFINKDDWSPNLPDLSPLDYHVWVGSSAGMQPKPKTIPQLKDAL